MIEPFNFSSELPENCIFAKSLHMNEDLIYTSAKQLVIVGLLFALLNSGLHQAVLYCNGVSQNFLDGFLVSFIGDITGAYIVFLLLKLFSKKFVKVGIPSIQ